MTRVLVVHKDEEESRAIVKFLKLHGYQAEAVRTGAAAIAGHAEADLVLLALDLPDLDGLAVCQEIRAAGTTPVIATVQRESELDRVLALQAGADSCVCVPYGRWELVARIEAVLRRVCRGASARRHVISRGRLRIDLGTREACVDGVPVLLTRKEFDVLHLLASRSGVVVSRGEIMAKIWHEDWAPGSRTIDTHISSLRTKLGGSGWIRNIRGVGYRIGDG